MMSELDQQLKAEAVYWGQMEEWTAKLPETPLWVDIRRGGYLPYPRHYLPAMAASFDPITYNAVFGRCYHKIFSCIRDAGSHVLEIGCGSGFMSLEMARMGKRVRAFDLSKPRITFARHYYEKIISQSKLSGSIEYFTANAEERVADSGSCDAVLCHGSLHHLRELDGALDQIHDYLKPGGVLIAFEHSGLDPHLNSIFERIDHLVGLLWQQPKVCRLLDNIFRRPKKSVKHPVCPQGGSPLEDTSMEDLLAALDRSRFTCITRELITPFAFHFIERYATVYDWYAIWKFPALGFLKLADVLLKELGFRGEVILWVGTSD